jgi:uncharacterized protein YvpB
MITVGTLVIVLTVMLGEMTRANEYGYVQVHGSIFAAQVNDQGGASDDPSVSPSDFASDQGDASADRGDLPAKFIIPDVPAMSQFPVFYNGCELVSVAMLMQYKGWEYTLETLNTFLPKDPTPVILGRNGKIMQWGDPSVGFVGDITGKRMGYSVNHEPLIAMMTELLGEDADRIVNLTGTDERRLKAEIAAGNPVVIWTTINFQPTEQWIAWSTAEGKTIRGTLQVHAALLVGYDETHFYINNPYTGGAYEQAAKDSFIASWAQMNKQALTIR